MALLSVQDVSIGFGEQPLLERASMQVEKGEKVCLLGRNGEGKTTFLRLIGGEIESDSGIISFAKGTTVAGLSQDLPRGIEGLVFEVVTDGLNRLRPKGRQTDPFNGRPEAGSDNRLEAEEGSQVHRQVKRVLTGLSLDPNAYFETLSVGFRRRVLLARALAADPDILLLDEPTNHLDIHTIIWMEAYLQKFRGTILFVTHDRMFLQGLATRIIELDRGRIRNWACGYREFLERREEFLEVEEAQRNRFTKKLAKEEEWIRKGIKARRTRNEGRVRALMKMREEQQAWRAQTGTARIRIQEAGRTGKLVIEGEGIHHGYGGIRLIRNFSVKIVRGARIGIIGPNGIGKSTLLKILLGDVTAEKGKVRRGTHLEVVYFDQLREQLDEEKTVQENVAEGKDFLDMDGSRRHVLGYLKDFLFSPDRARSPVRILSGGERNRLLLARLFSRPSNLLVLDEPTNDLDMETLELLEDRLMDYSGTVLLVSHDREFLNNVVTSTLVFEGDGVINEYAGGYDDWLTQRPQTAGEQKADRKGTNGKPAAGKQQEKKTQPRKLTFKERNELDALPGAIEGLEQEQKSLYTQMADPELYRGGGEGIGRAQARLDELGRELEGAYARWEELESIREENGGSSSGSDHGK